MNLTNEQAERLINDDICPVCGKDLDTGYECTGCGKDWRETVEALLSGDTEKAAKYLMKQAKEVQKLVPSSEMVTYTSRKMRVAILSHADEDGFGAAFAAHTALSGQHELLFKEVQYGEDPPYDELRTFGPDQVYILDFSYKAPVLQDLMNFWPVVVIDHHKTAAEDLKYLPPCHAGAAEREKSEGRVGTYFPEIEVVSFFEKDGVQFPIFNGVRVLQENSGCVLAWLFFCPGQVIPDILHYVQDAALGRHELESFAPINEFIKILPRTFEAWADFYMPLAYDAGNAIIAYKAKNPPAVGMYGETPQVRCGKFIISRQDSSSLWIQIDGEEGMQCPDNLFEAALSEFFTQHF